MRFYLDHGLLPFIGAKCLLFIPALLLAEWYRHRNPRLIAGTLRVVIVLYVGLYSVGVFALNRRVEAKSPHTSSRWEDTGGDESFPTLIRGPLADATVQ
jgi:hypothetical protein